ncbi:ATP-binding protein [Streptomyces sp. NPDC048516]|uniref:ATP-binding protein n=1 Tax=Streptomyces sp. NPDC048516 TaxID=3365565 RepID=UPI00371C38E3
MPQGRARRRWKTGKRCFAGPKHLIIDELGHLPLPEDGASALLQVIKARYLKSSRGSRPPTIANRVTDIAPLSRLQ